MMLNTGHLASGLDASTATFTLTVFLAGAALAVFGILVIYLIRRAGLAAIVGVLSGAGLVLVGAMLAAVLLDRQLGRDHAAERRAIELRAAELTAHAIAPGSALACLDGVTGSVVETACEKALFATPEAVAAAVDYVDARLSLLAASTSLAERDKSYQPAFDRLRRALEEDRFGLVAHVLATRGCSPTECADLALFRDTDRVVANMKAQTFESRIGVHALAWQPNGPALAASAAASPSPSSPLPSTVMTGLSPMPPPPTTTGGPVPGGKFDFPSSASIPPVSIMSAEPGAPPAAEPKPAAVPKRERGPIRRQAARPQAAPQPSLSAAPPPPPLNTAPPQQAAPPEPPQTSGAADRSPAE